MAAKLDEFTAQIDYVQFQRIQTLDDFYEDRVYLEDRLRLLLKTIREITEVKELTSGLIHPLIERIEVHNNDKYDGHCHVKVDIYFSVIGMMDIPDEKEIQTMMNEVQKNPQKYRYAA